MRRSVVWTLAALQQTETEETAYSVKGADDFSNESRLGAIPWYVVAAAHEVLEVLAVRVHSVQDSPSAKNTQPTQRELHNAATATSLLRHQSQRAPTLVIHEEILHYRRVARRSFGGNTNGLSDVAEFLVDCGPGPGCPQDQLCSNSPVQPHSVTPTALLGEFGFC
jgi:hypothetical protein